VSEIDRLRKEQGEFDSPDSFYEYWRNYVRATKVSAVGLDDAAP
jgi:hypothetical protein